MHPLVPTPATPGTTLSGTPPVTVPHYRLYTLGGQTDSWGSLAHRPGPVAGTPQQASLGILGWPGRATPKTEIKPNSLAN